MECLGKKLLKKCFAIMGFMMCKWIFVPGQLTDHYNPVNKTVNLSEGVYMQRNAATAAVAATNVVTRCTTWLAILCCNFVLKLVPLVNISSTLSQFVIFAWDFCDDCFRSMQNPQGNTTVLGLVFYFCGNYTFAFITLPVEYDASKRASLVRKFWNIRQRRTCCS